MLTLEYAKDPIWNDDTGQSVLLTVKWAEFNEEMPFGATTYDPEQYGRDLYNRALAGEFGVVGAYVATPVAANNQPATTGSQDL
jgi:hypothetical protein